MTQDGNPEPPTPWYAPPPSYLPPSQSYPASDTPTTGLPTSGMPGPGYPTPGYGPGFPQAGPPGYPPYPPYPPMPAQPRKNRRVVLITTLVVVLALLATGGGVVWFVGNRIAEGTGAVSSTHAVSLFTMDIYEFYDVASATGLTCPAARDKNKIVAKVNEVKAQNARYDTPKYSFSDPKVVRSDGNREDVTQTITLRTRSAQTATQNLKFITTKGKTGWFVCDVQPA